MKKLYLTATVLAGLFFGTSASLIVSANTKEYRPTATKVVVHKYLIHEANPALENYYWGNGNETTAFAGWQPAGNQFSFTAFRIPRSAITGFDVGEANKIVFNSETGLTIGGETKTWSQILETVKVASPKVTEGDVETTSPIKSEWTIKVKSDINLAALETALRNDERHDETVSTNESGAATFNALKNGNYIVLETAHPAYIKTTERAVPMVLHLPLINPDTTKHDAGYWFDDTQHALNLYAKNQRVTGDLTVKKYDSDDATKKQQLPGAVIAIYQGDVKAQVINYLQSVTGQALLAAAKGKPADATEVTALNTAIKTAIAGSSGDFNAIKTTQETGTTFNDLEPGQTYTIVELASPVHPKNQTDAEFLLDPNVTTVTLSSADEINGPTNGSGGGQTIRYYGGHVDLENDDFTITKKVNPNVPIDAENAQTAPITHSDFVTNDEKSGVARGQQIQWAIRSEINHAEKLATYSLSDTLPY
ncbi:hypothetical protein H9L19_02660 [Weissella diestrammenae]|uniref:Gram-positive pilin subunit D1 N-terminal domain-containing protein n=1 Tax=Weissella diestrammenae TaxID=1162633 RepID=A0A7G9T6Q8_9LACO|nr:SpaA isopeptide-forming pilin-related protein [Weissella diestrammenae]MCM0582933.1 hypothetical protein [Weissella diestrammenae]QNN75783.1 hypothetical protein H9L19_02660 [Weissella diestrammenae]